MTKNIAVMITTTFWLVVGFCMWWADHAMWCQIKSNALPPSDYLNLLPVFGWMGIVLYSIEGLIYMGGGKYTFGGDRRSNAVITLIRMGVLSLDAFILMGWPWVLYKFQDINGFMVFIIVILGIVYIISAITAIMQFFEKDNVMGLQMSMLRYAGGISATGVQISETRKNIISFLQKTSF